MNSSVMHGPFVPFAILYSQAIQRLDLNALEYLDRFTVSLKPETDAPQTVTHPYKVYKLLCDGAHLCFNARIRDLESESTLGIKDSANMSDDNQHLLWDASDATISEEPVMQTEGLPIYGLDDWYQGNQEVLGLFDDPTLF
jgi:hypothetical protein